MNNFINSFFHNIKNKIKTDIEEKIEKSPKPTKNIIKDNFSDSGIINTEYVSAEPQKNFTEMTDLEYNKLKNVKILKELNTEKTKKKYLETKSNKTEKLEKTEKTDNIDKIFKDYFEHEDIIESSFDDISTKFLEIVNSMEVGDLNFPSEEFDVLFTGGGLKGYYNFGACEILKKMVQKNKIKIRNYIGVSVGAYVAIFLLLGISVHTVRNVYEFAKQNSNKYDLNKIMLKACENLLPNNAHELCNGKLKILVSELTIKGMVPVMIDKFDSKEHLIKVLHATSFIPFITSTESKGVVINGKKYYDGAFTNNIPIQKNNEVPQLVFLTAEVEYSKDYMFKVMDDCPELLILRGAIEMEKFIKKINKIETKLKINKIKDIPIQWIETDNHYRKISKHSQNDYQKILLNILLIASLIVSSVSNILNLGIVKKYKKNYEELKSKTYKSKTHKSKTHKSKTLKSKTYKSEILTDYKIKSD